MFRLVSVVIGGLIRDTVVPTVELRYFLGATHLLVNHALNEIYLI